VNKIKIAIVDDHPMLLKGMQGILGCVPYIEITGAYLNGQALLADIVRRLPDILLLDIQMSGLSGEELAMTLRTQYPSVKILAFTNQEQTYFIRSMIDHGVMGYVLKTCDEETLLKAIQTIHRGESYFDPMIRGQVSQITNSISRHPRLTRREKEILQLIAENYSSKEIGERLCMGKRTVDNYRTALLLKLDAKNSAGLVKKAIDLGLIR
jgi:DNA-binding NarL/FixJ family response regulator